MAVDRSLLAQALGNNNTSSYLSASQGQRNLLQGQNISQMAMDSSNFGNGQARGIGLAAQLATAGIGAYTQYKAQKDINEQELASQAQFAKQFPHLADIAPTLSADTRQAYTLESLKNTLKASDPAAQLDLQSKQLEVQGKKLGLQKTQAEIGKLNKETANVGNRQDKAPQGYTFNQDGSLKPIIGGPADKSSQPLSQEAAKTLTIANDGIEAIGNIRNQFTDPKTGKFLEGVFSKASGGSKFLPSMLQPEQAQKFSTYQANTIDTIGRLRSGGAINENEEKRFLRMVPNFGDKAATVDLKLKQLESTFNSVQTGIDPEGKRSKTTPSTPASSGFKILNVRDK